MGQMNQRGDELFISVELIKVKDQSRLWGTDYKRKTVEIQTIEGEISSSVSNSLRLSLTPDEKAGLVKKYTEDNEAYKLYLRAIDLSDRGDFKRSDEYLHQTLEKDPNFAEVYVYMGKNFNEQGYFGLLSPDEAFPKAKEAALKALELDETLGGAHSVLGTAYLLHDWDWEAAERENRQALKLSLNNAQAHYSYALYLMSMGRNKEAFEEQKLAIELDPISLELSAVLGVTLSRLGQHDKALEQYNKVLEENPNHYMAQSYLVLELGMRGMYDEAIALAENSKNREILPILGFIYALSGNKEKALEILDTLIMFEKQGLRIQVFIAAIYGGFGDMDKAFEWLDKGYEKRDPRMSSLKILERLEPMRPDPRFKAMLKKMNLE
jgi:tetratricopeptide (TPR) repeat protein